MKNKIIVVADVDAMPEEEFEKLLECIKNDKPFIAKVKPNRRFDVIMTKECRCSERE